MTDFATFHDHFRSGLTFEQARDRAGFGACSCAAAMLLARYWNLLEMERAVDLAASYFDRLEGLGMIPFLASTITDLMIAFIFLCVASDVRRPQQ